VDQEWLSDIGKELFNPSQTTWSSSPERLLDPNHVPPLDNSLAQYTGGDVRVERDLSQMALGPAPYPNLAHLVVGFQVNSEHRINLIKIYQII
jgi:processing peptidase subunit alpha